MDATDGAQLVCKDQLAAGHLVALDHVRHAVGGVDARRVAGVPDAAAEGRCNGLLEALTPRAHTAGDSTHILAKSVDDIVQTHALIFGAAAGSNRAFGRSNL